MKANKQNHQILKKIKRNQTKARTVKEKHRKTQNRYKNEWKSYNVHSGIRKNILNKHLFVLQLLSVCCGYHQNIETKKPRNRETKKPRNQETDKPRNHETKKPRNQKTKKPRNHKPSPRKSRNQYLFHARGSPTPLNIPTPTPAPDQDFFL